MNLFYKDEHCEAPEIPSLVPVLQGWIDTQRAYLKACPDDDPPWHYRERSCIGFLAAGAWRSGGVAIEEWLTERLSESGRSSGRGDLWIRCRDQNSFCIEAKRMRPNPNVMGNLDKQLVEMESKLSHAVIDVGTHERHSCEKQLGVLFVAPAYPNGPQEGIDESLATWLEGIYSLPHSAIAWIFPNRAELQPTSHSTIPGIVLIARTGT